MLEQDLLLACSVDRSIPQLALSAGRLLEVLVPSPVLLPYNAVCVA